MAPYGIISYRSCRIKVIVLRAIISFGANSESRCAPILARRQRGSSELLEIMIQTLRGRLSSDHHMPTWAKLIFVSGNRSCCSSHLPSRRRRRWLESVQFDLSGISDDLEHREFARRKKESGQGFSKSKPKPPRKPPSRITKYPLGPRRHPI